MKALVRYSHLPKKLKIKEIPFPKIGNSSHEAIVEVKYAGICGRDIEHYNSKISKKKIPSVLGHEFSGIIQKINKNKYNIKSGDRVTCETVKSVCEKCNLCKSGFIICAKIEKTLEVAILVRLHPTLKSQMLIYTNCQKCFIRRGGIN